MPPNAFPPAPSGELPDKLEVPEPDVPPLSLSERVPALESNVPPLPAAALEPLAPPDDSLPGGSPGGNPERPDAVQTFPQGGGQSSSFEEEQPEDVAMPSKKSVARRTGDGNARAVIPDTSRKEDASARPTPTSSVTLQRRASAGPSRHVSQVPDRLTALATSDEAVGSNQIESKPQGQRRDVAIALERPIHLASSFE